MKKYLSISLVALVLATNLNCYAANNQRAESIELTQPQDIQDANKMENALERYLTQKIDCVNKKLMPRSACDHLTEFNQVKKVYQNTVTSHPSWRDSRIHWVYPHKDHHIEFHSLKIKFE